MNKPSANAAAIVSEVLACRICKGALSFKWKRQVLKRYDAEYYECNECHALQVVAPSWLEEAYAGENDPRAFAGDTGRFRRNYSYFLYLTALSNADLFPESPRILDYGGGYGLFTQMLCDAGYDAWQTDLHVSTPFFAPDRQLMKFSEIEPRSFDIVISMEVFEHLLDPLAVGSSLVRLLKPGGHLVISTGVYSPGVHDENWEYLAPDGGQHITFWSRNALRRLAAHLGFRSVGYFPGPGGLLVFSPLSEPALVEAMAKARTLLDKPGYCNLALERWDFRSTAVVTQAAGGGEII